MNLNEDQIGLNNIIPRDGSDHPDETQNWPNSSIPESYSYSSTVDNSLLSSDTADVVGTGGQSLRVDISGADNEWGFLAYTPVDVTDLNEVSIQIKDANNETDTTVWVGDDELAEFEGSSSYQEFTYDVSGMSGEVIITLGHYFRSGTTYETYYDELVVT